MVRCVKLASFDRFPRCPMSIGVGRVRIYLINESSRLGDRSVLKWLVDLVSEYCGLD